MRKPKQLVTLIKYMMNVNSRKFITIPVAAAVALQMLVPSFLFAQSPTPATTPSEKGFCNVVVQHGAQIDQRLTQRKDRVTQRRTERKDRIAERHTLRDQKRQDTRAKADARWLELSTKLQEKATTDEQKQAVVQFKLDVQSAVDTRRVAVDGAVSGFRASMDKAIADYKAVIDLAVADFKASVKAATDQAKADCAAGVASKTVRSTFQNSLKAAREEWKRDRESATKLRTSVEPVIAARKAAIQKAHQDFKTAMTAARAKLKQAFPGETPSVSPTPAPTPVQ